MRPVYEVLVDSPAVAYDDAAFRRELLARGAGQQAVARPKKVFLRLARKAVAPKDEMGPKIPSLHGIAVLLSGGKRSGLDFGTLHGIDAYQKTDALWSRESAQALLHVIGQADLQAVRVARAQCEDVFLALQNVLRICKSELPGVNARLRLEDQRIARISVVKRDGKSSGASPGARNVELLSKLLDGIDRAERDLLAAACALKQRNAEIAEYLLIDSAMRAALEISNEDRLMDDEVSARDELNELRVAVERVESALTKADEVVRAGNVSRISKR